MQYCLISSFALMFDICRILGHVFYQIRELSTFHRVRDYGIMVSYTG